MLGTLPNGEVDHNYFMKEALKEARKAFEADEVPVGAVIVAQGRIIARSHNLTEMLTDPTAHAEMQAITSATAHIGGKYLQECTLYVTLEPCMMCAGATYWAHLGQLVYGASDAKRGYNLFEGTNAIDKVDGINQVHPKSNTLDGKSNTLHPKSNILHPKTTVVSGIMAEEAAELLRQFFQKKRSN